MSPHHPPERTLFEQCLDLCSSQEEREKVRSLAIRLHLSETASEWAILLLHAEARALFGPRSKPPSLPPPQPRRIESALLLGSAIAGGGITLLLSQHASSGAIFVELAMTGLCFAWAVRR